MVRDYAKGWAATPPNRLAEAIADFQRSGTPFIDLATASPHDHGLNFPQDALAGIAAGALPAARRYAPDSAGALGAREAVSAFYRRRGLDCPASRIVLSPGTSQAYFYALSLLAAPGDSILVPRPGYPLFDDIAALSGVSLRHYHLRGRGGGWEFDSEEIAFQCTAQTRAVVVVSPHNPTGLVAGAEELDRLAAICRQRGIALLFDEVFSECLAEPGPCLPRPLGRGFPLGITLNGFSKMFALPGWKVGWMALDGDDDRVAQFTAALHHMNDTFLPLTDLVQAMVPGILEVGDPAVSQSLAAEYRLRRRVAEEALAVAPLRSDGGVYVSIPLPEGADDEEAALRALRERCVLVHPGYYYEMPGHLVFTCVPAPDVLREGVLRLNEVIRSTA